MDFVACSNIFYRWMDWIGWDGILKLLKFYKHQTYVTLAWSRARPTKIVLIQKKYSSNSSKPNDIDNVFSQPSIYIDGWLYGMRMTSVVCNVLVLSQNDSTYHHSVFTTWKWHPFATWTPSFIILVWGHHPPLRRTVFACLQNCYNSCIGCSRSALRYDSINSNLMNYSWTNGRLAIPAPAGLLVSPSGSQAILVFLCQRAWQYSDGNSPDRGVECRWGMLKYRSSTNIWLCDQWLLHRGLYIALSGRVFVYSGYWTTTQSPSSVTVQCETDQAHSHSRQQESTLRRR